MLRAKNNAVQKVAARNETKENKPLAEKVSSPLYVYSVVLYLDSLSRHVFNGTQKRVDASSFLSFEIEPTFR